MTIVNGEIQLHKEDEPVMIRMDRVIVITSENKIELATNNPSLAISKVAELSFKKIQYEVDIFSNGSSISHLMGN